jgi:hypothetical protein
MNRILTLAAASAFIMGATTFAQADAKMMMEAMAACNASYAQCVKDGTDLTLASTPSEGAEKIKMNMENGKSCGEAARACYAAAK